MNEFRYRYELKFLCTQIQLKILENQISYLMEKDKHSGEKGFYTVRSLYFDDYRNSAMKQKEDGTDYRKKYRIRSYMEGTDEQFNLEIKYRVKDKIRKETCMLTREETAVILEGKPLENAYADKERIVLRQFEALRDSDCLQPAVIVEYDRIPYVYPEGNVRITLDKNICASTENKKFMEKNIFAIPILNTGYHLLEIKYDEYLPDIIRQTLQIISLQKVSFSKYYLCRMAGGRSE